MFYQTEDSKPLTWETLTTSSNVNLEDQEFNNVVGNAQRLTELLKTPDLSDENIDLINALITGELANLVDCGCDEEVDFTGMSIEEMIDVLG